MRELKLNYTTKSLKRMSTKRLNALADSVENWYYHYRGHGPAQKFIKVAKLVKIIKLIREDRRIKAQANLDRKFYAW